LKPGFEIEEWKEAKRGYNRPKSKKMGRGGVTFKFVREHDIFDDGESFYDDGTSENLTMNRSFNDKNNLMPKGLAGFGGGAGAPDMMAQMGAIMMNMM